MIDDEQSPQRPRRVVLADVAEAAGVSIGTVSRALSGRGDLLPPTRLRVQQIARDLGYHRRGARSTCAPGPEARIFELVLGLFDDPWTDEVVAGARAAASRLGFDLVLTQERDDPEDDWVERVVARRSSGVLLGLIRPTRTELARLESLSIPVAVLEPTSDPHDQLPSVGTTDRQGGHDAGRHLLELGHRRFVIVSGEPRFRFGRAREEGFRDAVAEAGLPASAISTVRGDWQDTDLRPALKGLLLPGTSVFACNDAMATSVYRAIRAAGLRIPADISVVGFDDAPEAGRLAPPLTTVRQPIRQMAGRAIEVLVHLHNGEPQPFSRAEVATQLIVRHSTAPPASNLAQTN